MSETETFDEFNSPVFHAQGRHRQLWLDREFFGKLGGYQPKWLLQPLSPYVSELEVRYVKEWRKYLTDEIYGLTYTGEFVPPYGYSVPVRFQVMAATWARIFVDARVRGVKDLVDEAPDCTILLIPDLVSDKEWTEYIKSSVVSVIHDRIRAGQPTVAYISKPKKLLASYGKDFHSMLNSSFRNIQL